MKKIEKFRKICKYSQYAAMILLVGGGVFLVYKFGLKDSNENSMTNTALFTLLTIVALFAFMLLVVVPMQNKLLHMVIEESLKDVVSNLKFDRKKGYSKEQFEKLRLVNEPFGKYHSVDYYSFTFNGLEIESTTVRAYDEFKIPKEKGKKGSKSGKKTVNYFFGRVYIVPFEFNDKFNVYGKKNPTASKRKELVDAEYNVELPLKFKKYNDNFEVYYKDKPTMDINAFLEKLLSLKLASKGAISIFVRNKSFVLCIDNSRHYEEIDIKNPVKEDLIRGYKKDVTMVLSFINSLLKEQK